MIQSGQNQEVQHQGKFVSLIINVWPIFKTHMIYNNKYAIYCEIKDTIICSYS